MKVAQQQEAAMLLSLILLYKTLAIHFPVSIGNMKHQLVSLVVLAVCLTSVKLLQC
jgi:hypothetical protein